MTDNNTIRKAKNLQMTDISIFFALLALFWMYPLRKITVVSKLLLPSILGYEIAAVALSTGIIFGIWGFIKSKNAYPLIANFYMFLVYMIFLQHSNKPCPTYLVFIILMGVFVFIALAVKEVINSTTNYELYFNLSKYLFFLSLVIKALGGILSYQTHVGDINILAIILLIIGTIFGYKAREINKKLWMVFNIIFLIITLIDSFFVLSLDVLFRFL